MATRRQGPKRQTTWFDTNIGLDIAQGTGGLVRLTPIADDLEGFTAIWIVGRTTLLPSVPQSTLAETSVAIGFAVCSEEAFVSGLVGTPNPEQSQDFPERGWMYRARYVVIDNGFGVPTNIIVMDNNIRAQRKIDKGVLYLTIHNQTIRGSNFNVRLHGTLRLLCLRP